MYARTRPQTGKDPKIINIRASAVAGSKESFATVDFEVHKFNGHDDNQILADETPPMKTGTEVEINTRLTSSLYRKRPAHGR